VVFELSGRHIEARDTNAGIETLEERVSKLLPLGESRQSFLHLTHLVDVERNHRHSTAHFSRHFLLLVSVRQRTEKEAVAGGLFAVLGRKRGKVSGQVPRRTGPAQLFIGSSTLHLFVAALLSRLFVRQQQTTGLLTTGCESIRAHL
jgi:hypothetical protein